MSLFFPNGQRLQQDNDPKHRSIMAQEIMAENGINHWDVWPSGKYMYSIVQRAAFYCKDCPLRGGSSCSHGMSLGVYMAHIGPAYNDCRDTINLQN